MSRLGLFALLSAMVGALLAIALLFDPRPSGAIDVPHMVRLVMTAGFIGASVVLGVWARPGLGLRHALLWIVIFTLLTAGYAFLGDAPPFLSDARPAGGGA